MNVWKIIGKIGAGALGLGGLILAGKAGFGENLKFGRDDEDDFVDDCDVCGETAENVPENDTPEVTETEEEVPE